MFSVVVLTLNEERALGACLASVRGCDDILVLDSGSTDRTVEIARSSGARTLVHPFETFAQQRTHAHRAGRLRHPWVFHLDADERFTPELFAECLAWGDPDAIDGAYVAPRMLVNGSWVRRSTDFPAYQARFAHRERFRWIQSGHGQRERPDMRMATLAHAYTHETLAAGEAAWLEKHRRYAWIEAEHHTSQNASFSSAALSLLGTDRLERRRALKRLSYALPARPALRFLYQYVLRGGFLDGRAGWLYCRLLARYEAFAGEAMRARRTGSVRGALPAPQASRSSKTTR